ncbi:MAG: hypothetical protein ACR2NN_01045 [Bryobacteraceae bacterium]
MWIVCLALLLSNVKAVNQDLPDEDPQVQLTKVRRIFVDTLTGGDSALMIRDLLMTSLQGSKLFIITEDEDRADAILKGAGEDTIFTDLFSSTEGLNAHANVSTPDVGSSNSRYSGWSVAGMSVGENESRKTEERKHEAIATVRLVNKDGDVIWSTTQESFGGKFMGAAADVANKVAKRLIADYKVAKRQTEQ